LSAAGVAIVGLTGCAGGRNSRSSAAMRASASLLRALLGNSVTNRRRAAMAVVAFRKSQAISSGAGAAGALIGGRATVGSTLGGGAAATLGSGLGSSLGSGEGAATGGEGAAGVAIVGGLALDSCRAASSRLAMLWASS